MVSQQETKPQKWRADNQTFSRVAIFRFLKYAERFTPNTQRQYRDTLWRFFKYLPTYIEQTTAEHIEIFLQSLQMLNSSKNTRLIPIHSFFRYLEDYHDIPNIAVKVKDLPEQPHKQRVISEDEYGELLKVCKPKERAVIKFLANTGLRASEFGDLTPQCISLDQRYITVIGKGQKRRVVPLNDTCREVLSRLDLTKNYKSRNSLYRLCLSLSKRANLPAFGPHALRHFFCTRLIKAGVPLVKVSRILGHSSIAITEKVYLHLLPCDFLGVTDVLKDEQYAGEGDEI